MASQEKVNINFRVTEAERKRFYRAAKRDGEVPASLLRRFMRAYAKGDITQGFIEKEGK